MTDEDKDFEREAFGNVIGDRELHDFLGDTEPRIAAPDEEFESFDNFLEKEKRTHFSRFTSHQRKIGMALVMVLIVGVGIVVAQTLFSQTLTPPTVVASAVLTRNCEPVPPTPGAIVSGTGGFVTWACSATVGAFHVNGAGSVTPIVTSGSPWTTTFIWSKSGTAPTGTACATASINKAIVSGTSVTFGSGDVGDWNYCTEFAGATNPMPTISYQWSQP